MYIKEIKFENYGPISSLDITPKFDANGKPKPIVLIGKNGSGKTLLLGNILDGLIELKREKYASLQEVGENKYLKVGKKDYIKNNQECSYVKIEFGEETNTATFIDLMSRINHADFLTNHGNKHFEGQNDPKFIESGFYKNCSIHNREILKCFETNIISFFPHSRYDHPAWLNKETKIGFSFKEKFIDQIDKSIIKHDVIKEVETWILDCLLDREIYEKQFFQLQGNSLNVFAGYNGKNSDIINLINELLKIIYRSKFPNLQSARIGIGAKDRRSISIHVTEHDEEFIVSPSFSHISSGEAMLLSLFTALLKEFDDLGIHVTKLEDVKGIVIIDEIDLHLHIEFQKTILPELIKRFTNVQFILTTHSPFFLYGMEETYRENWELINLPFGNKIGLHDFSEMKNAYDIFVSGFNKLQNTFNMVNSRLQNLSKPLIITEGKTDWKHFKHAFERFNEKGKFIDLDFDFLEYEDDIEMGDSHLKALCEQTAKLNNNRKVICIFDRDDAKIIQSMDGSNCSSYKEWGNSVYSFCIPKPSHRDDYRNISIEFYYTDDDIKTIDTNTNKRLFFTNEIEEIMIKSKTIKNKVTSKINVLEIPKKDEENDKKIYCEDVALIQNGNGVSIAHSKNVFAEKILNKEDNFDKFGVDEFEKVFIIINEILNK